MIDFLLQSLGALLNGAVTTLEVTAGTLALAILIGAAFAAAQQLVRSPALHFAISAYIEIFRNVPSLTYLFIVYFGLAYVGIRLSSIMGAILGLGLIGGAVLTDVFRAGLQAIPKDQHEGALALGLSRLQTFRLVIVPQARRICLPPLGNYAIGLVKDTSLVAAIAAPEIMFNARQIVNESFQATLVYGLAALVYLAITCSLGHVFKILERRAAY
jgi:polar amino acid transport system permease protein